MNRGDFELNNGISSVTDSEINNLLVYAIESPSDAIFNLNGGEFIIENAKQFLNTGIINFKEGKLIFPEYFQIYHFLHNYPGFESSIYFGNDLISEGFNTLKRFYYYHENYQELLKAERDGYFKGRKFVWNSKTVVDGYTGVWVYD